MPASFLIEMGKIILAEELKEENKVRAYAIALNVVKNAINSNGRFKKDGLQEAYNTIEDYGLEREKFTKSLEMMQG